MPRIITAKQERFIQEYLIDLNATQAAIRAGYSAKNADKIGWELLGKTRVAEVIEKAKAERAQKANIDAVWVLERLKELFEMDRTEMYDDAGKMKAPKNWPPVLRRLLRSIKKTEIQFYGDPLRVLELIGKHVTVGAFRDEIQQTGDVRLTVVYSDGKK